MAGSARPTVLHVTAITPMPCPALPTVSVGFFTDIFISPSHMMPDTEWNETEQIWIWRYIVEEGIDPLLYHFDIGASCRIRVNGVTYYQEEDTSTSRPALDAAAAAAAAQEPDTTGEAAATPPPGTTKAIDGSLVRSDGAVSTAAQTPEDFAKAQAALNDSLMSWVITHKRGTDAATTMATDGGVQLPTDDSGAVQRKSNPAMAIAGSVGELGLGVVAWWAEVAADADIDEDFTVNGERITASDVMQAEPTEEEAAEGS